MELQVKKVKRIGIGIANLHCQELEWNWELGIFVKKNWTLFKKNWNWKFFIALSITCAIPFKLNCSHPCLLASEGNGMRVII